jgi:TolB-like protein/Tfp pilus assembly protein PilF
MSEPTTAVFLSYASQDATTARRICEALRAAGVEVWFDQSELVGGDAWDAKIRKQIAECALFVPVISAATQARKEGYFRLEWKLAAQRTHMMSEQIAFLLPVVIDATRDPEADVPGEFKAVQWTRLRPEGYGGQARIGPADSLDAFCARVKKLLEGAETGSTAGGALHPDRVARPTESARKAPPTTGHRARWLPFAIAGALALVALATWQTSQPDAREPAVATAQAPTAVSPAEALVAKARALLEDDPLRTRRNLELAEQFCLQAIALDQTSAEALAAAAWVNFLFLDENYDDTPQRRADLRRYAEAAALLAPQSVNAQLSLSGVLIATGNRPEAVKRLTALAELHPTNFTVLRQLVWAASWRSDSNWGTTAEEGEAALERLRAHSPLGRSHADSILASRHWARGEYAAADRLVDGVFASGLPVRQSYLSRLLILAFGWGDLERAKAFIATIPEKLLLEDVFICHVATVWVRLGDYDRALATLNRTQRELLHEARIELPTAMLRGNAHAAAGRPNAALVEWRAARQVVERQLQTDPRKVAAHENLLELLVRLGEPEAAARQFTLLMEMLHPTEGSVAWAKWFGHFVRIGDIDAAVARVDRLISRDHGRWANTYNELRHEPLLAKLRKDPRVQPILARAAGWLEEMRASASSTVSSPVGLAKTDKSVAVLAFANLSDDKANEYFSDGISEELLNVLAKVPGLKVSARTSAFHFKGKDTPIPEIAKQLGVAYVVEGSVRKAGDKVRITAQLIKAADGFHIWSDNFTRDLKDIFAVQDEIAGRIAQELSLKLGVSSAAATTAVNPEAFELYVRARQAWNQRTPAGFDLAEELLRRALQLEPKFARAHAALADVWTFQAIERRMLGSFGQRHSSEYARLRAQVDRALALDPDLAEARATLGNLLHQGGNFAASERELRRAIALNPNYASGHQWLGRVLQSTAQFDAAREALARAAALDPLSPRILDNYAALLRDAGREIEALGLIERALALQPDARQASMWKALSLSALDRHEEAVALLRRQSFDGTPYVAEALRVLMRAGLKAEAEQMLERNPEADRFRALAALGRPQEALDAVRLDRISIMTFSLGFINPDYDPIRQDPRYVALLAELGMTEAHARARAWRAAHPLPPAKRATPRIP